MNPRITTTYSVPRLGISIRNAAMLTYWLAWGRHQTPAYPPDMQAARRAAFIEQIHAMQPDECDGPEARLAAIDNALGQEYDLETVNNLLEEKAELQIQLEKE
jgi:hypothetical protein